MAARGWRALVLAALCFLPLTPAAAFAQALPLPDRLCAIDARRAVAGLSSHRRRARRNRRTAPSAASPRCVPAVTPRPPPPCRSTPPPRARHHRRTLVRAAYCASRRRSDAAGGDGSQVQAVIFLLAAFRRAASGEWPCGAGGLPARARRHRRTGRRRYPRRRACGTGRARPARSRRSPTPASASPSSASSTSHPRRLDARARMRGRTFPPGSQPARDARQSPAGPRRGRGGSAEAAARAAATRPAPRASKIPRPESSGRPLADTGSTWAAPPSKHRHWPPRPSAIPTAQARSLAAGLDGRLALARGDAPAARASSSPRSSPRASVRCRPACPLICGSPKPIPPAAPRHVQAAYAALDNLRPLLPRFDPLTEETTFSLYMRDVFIAAVEVELATRRAQPSRCASAAPSRSSRPIARPSCRAPSAANACRRATPLQPEDLRPGEILLYPLLLADRSSCSTSPAATGGRRAALSPAAAQPRRRPRRRRRPGRAAGPRDERRRQRRRGGPARAALRPADRADRRPSSGPARCWRSSPTARCARFPFAALLAPTAASWSSRPALSLIPALAYSQPAASAAASASTSSPPRCERQMTLPAGFFPELDGTAEEARIAVSFAQRRPPAVPISPAPSSVGADRRQVDVLHLATHAAFNGRSDRAFIVANGEVIRLSELREMIDRQPHPRRARSTCIVLSACETAVGDDEASMGLAGAAVQAGARSVIGSLWQVNDAGTAELMREFYRLYGEGRPRVGGAARGAARADRCRRRQCRSRRLGAPSPCSEPGDEAARLASLAALAWPSAASAADGDTDHRRHRRRSASAPTSRAPGPSPPSTAAPAPAPICSTASPIRPGPGRHRALGPHRPATPPRSPIVVSRVTGGQASQIDGTLDFDRAAQCRFLVHQPGRDPVRRRRAHRRAGRGAFRDRAASFASPTAPPSR